MAIDIQLIVSSSFIAIFFFIGIAFVCVYFIKKIEKLKKPKTILNTNEKKVDKVSESIKKLTFEEKLIILKRAVGSNYCLVSIEYDTILNKEVGIIHSLEKTPEQDKPEQRKEIG